MNPHLNQPGMMMNSSQMTPLATPLYNGNGGSHLLNAPPNYQHHQQQMNPNLINYNGQMLDQYTMAPIQMAPGLMNQSPNVNIESTNPQLIV